MTSRHVCTANVFRVVLAFSVACSNPTDAPEVDRTALRDGALFQTDSSVYTLGRNTAGSANQIKLTFDNRTGLEAYLGNCAGAMTWNLERLVGDTWHLAYSPNFALCASKPIIVRTGDTLAIRLNFAGYPWNTNPPLPLTDYAGTYRVIFFPWSGNRQDGTFGALLPLSDRVSNRFTLSVPAR